MKITVEFKDRDLTFHASEDGGLGIDGLLSYIGEHKEKVSVVEISGESSSYTFLRQIYLLANLIREISGIEVIVNGIKIKPDQIVLPVYIGAKI